MGSVLRKIRTACAAVAAIVLTIVFGTYGVLVGFIPPRGELTLRGARWWGRAVLFVCGVRLRVEGAQRAEPGRSYVVMANHESAMDIPVLLAALPRGLSIRFMAKQSLFRIPFLGWSMHAMGFIPVDRADRSTAVRSFDAAAAHLKEERSILVFPEETRSDDGELLPFKRGGFLLALRAGLPILPVGLDGPRRAFPLHRFEINPTTVTVRYGEPIATAGLKVAARTELTERVRTDIDALRRQAAIDG